MIPTLTIQLLGSFLLRAGDAPVTTLDSQRLQALLAYLLLHRGAPTPRQHLAFLLWPDTAEAQARTNLRTLLHRLRQALPNADHFLYVDTQTVQWRAEAPFTLDVAEFEHALAQAEEADRAEDRARLRVALQAAVALYRGDLLPGCYDEWLLPERERLRQMITAALEQLTQLLETMHEYRAAIRQAQRLLQLDPLHEATYQRLMRLYGLNGDRASALRVYHTCAAVLERELGVAPSTATRAVYDDLQRTEPPTGPPAAPPAPGRRLDNLPIALTSFVGRLGELAEVRRLLGMTRLLTLTGAGGCGKSRLALAVAAEVVAGHPDGVWLVELAALTDGALVPQAVATALGVREEPQRPLTATLVDALQPRAMLLLLDNCEHLITACAQLAQQLLRACPGLQVLATSREALGVAGETTWLVPSLSLPDPHAALSVKQLAQSEAVQLFVERAAAALPTFSLTQTNAPAVAEICRRLDGIPLAIELAAARVKVLAVEQLAARLDDALRLLTGGSRTALPRHQTLRAALDWSYDLLSGPERALFRRLSVFAGGWALEAAEAYGRDVLELLAQLVDKSLVVVDTQAGNAARYRLLEPVRQYSREKLQEAGETEETQAAHLAFFLRLAEEAEPHLRTAAQPAWNRRLEIEHDNLRVALEWSLISGEAEMGLRLAVALHPFWMPLGYYAEARAWLVRLLEMPGARAPTLLRARALSSAYGVTWRLGDYDAARLFIEEGLELRRLLGDRQGLAWDLGSLANVIGAQGDHETAGRFWEESLSLAQEVGYKDALARALNGLGEIARTIGDYTQAARRYAESLSLYRELDNVEGTALLLHNLGYVRLSQGDAPQAVALFEESLALYQELGHKYGLSMCLVGLAGSATNAGRPVAAARLFGAAAALRAAIGTPDDPADRAEYERYMAATRARLDEAAFAAAWAEG
ncbi:MAG: tetratricopeptide repeat protein, partial [Chloroflexi bacterium]|nr:tetratricopeptide repeat protein [Chloroflexota bacterium]